MNAITEHEDAQILPADPIVSMIERMAMSPDSDMDKFERMLAMKERIDAQNARVAFSAALSAARSEIPPIIKDATVDFKSQKGHTHYKHETLAGIAKTIDPILSKFGLSYRFRTDQGNGGVRVTCIIEHSHGHSEETSLSGSPDTSGSKNSFQAVGSAVTYLQRYTLKAALGLSAEVDDDGQSAAPRTDQRHECKRQASVPPQQKTADQMISDLKQYGVGAVTSDQRFQRDLTALKSAAPEIAAQVEAEIDTLKKARNADLGGDTIEY